MAGAAKLLRAGVDASPPCSSQLFFLSQVVQGLIQLSIRSLLNSGARCLFSVSVEGGTIVKPFAPSMQIFSARASPNT